MIGAAIACQLVGTAVAAEKFRLAAANQPVIAGSAGDKAVYRATHPVVRAVADPQENAAEEVGTEDLACIVDSQVAAAGSTTSLRKHSVVDHPFDDTTVVEDRIASAG